MDGASPQRRVPKLRAHAKNECNERHTAYNFYVSTFHLNAIHIEWLLWNADFGFAESDNFTRGPRCGGVRSIMPVLCDVAASSALLPLRARISSTPCQDIC